MLRCSVSGLEYDMVNKQMVDLLKHTAMDAAAPLLSGHYKRQWTAFEDGNIGLQKLTRARTAALIPFARPLLRSGQALKIKQSDIPDRRP